MKLTVLGCSGSLPGPDSPASGYLVEAEGYRLLLDMGNGVLGPLQIHRPARVGCGDPVASACRPLPGHDVLHRGAALRTGRDRRRASRSSARPAPRTASRRRTTRWPASSACTSCSTSARAGDTELGPFAVSFAAVNHPVPANAIRLTRRRSHAGLFRRHRRERRPGRAGGGRRCAAQRGHLRPRRSVRAQPAPDRRPGRRSCRPGRRRSADRHPRAAVGLARGGRSEAATTFSRPVEAAQPGAVYEI